MHPPGNCNRYKKKKFYNEEGVGGERKINGIWKKELKKVERDTNNPPPRLNENILFLIVFSKFQGGSPHTCVCFLPKYLPMRSCQISPRFHLWSDCVDDRSNPILTPLPASGCIHLSLTVLSSAQQVASTSASRSSTVSSADEEGPRVVPPPPPWGKMVVELLM